MAIFGILDDKMTQYYKKIEDSGKFLNKSERSTKTGMGIHLFTLLLESYIKKKHSDVSVEKIIDNSIYRLIDKYRKLSSYLSCP